MCTRYPVLFNEILVKQLCLINQGWVMKCFLVPISCYMCIDLMDVLTNKYGWNFGMNHLLLYTEYAAPSHISRTEEINTKEASE